MLSIIYLLSVMRQLHQVRLLVVFNIRMLQIGDMRAVSGILYILLEKLRVKLGVLDISNGKQTGALLNPFQELHTMF